MFPDSEVIDTRLTDVYRIKEAIAFAKPYNPDAFLAVGTYPQNDWKI